MKIAFVHHKDARDVSHWSGTLYFQKQALERHLGEVVDLTPAPVNLLPYRAASRLVRMTTGKSWPYDQDVHLAKRFGRYFSDLLRKGDYDFVFSSVGSASTAFLETDVPIIHYSDATFRAAKDYYGCYSNILGRTERGGEEIERRAIEKASVLLYPSEWAARSAIEDYGADPSRVHVTYLGANLMHPPKREEVLPRLLGTTIRLLLVGVNWKIKGGDVALEVLRRLIDRGYDAELTVVGCTAPPDVSHPKMRVIPFLNKGNPDDLATFEQVWREADFFILPSRFEAAGIVFCEASAHALPILAAHTGGIPSLVLEGRNGYTIPHDREPEGYVGKIVELIHAPDRYAALAESTRLEYETRLNWDTWGERLREIVRERLKVKG